MANIRKYGYFKPVKRNYNPIRWVPKLKLSKKEVQRCPNPVKAV